MEVFPFRFSRKDDNVVICQNDPRSRGLVKKTKTGVFCCQAGSL